MKAMLIKQIKVECCLFDEKGVDLTELAKKRPPIWPKKQWKSPTWLKKSKLSELVKRSVKNHLFGKECGRYFFFRGLNALTASFISILSIYRLIFSWYKLHANITLSYGALQKHYIFRAHSFFIVLAFAIGNGLSYLPIFCKFNCYLLAVSEENRRLNLNSWRFRVHCFCCFRSTLCLSLSFPVVRLIRSCCFRGAHYMEIVWINLMRLHPIGYDCTRFLWVAFMGWCEYLWVESWRVSEKATSDWGLLFL